MNFWIFRSRFDGFDLGQLMPGHVETWGATQYSNDIRPNDVVLIWLSGQGAESGIYAWGRIASAPTGDHAKQPTVDVRYERRFEPRISAEAIRAHPGLQDIALFKTAGGTNFRVTPQDAIALALLFNDPVFSTLVRPSASGRLAGDADFPLPPRRRQSRRTRDNALRKGTRSPASVNITIRGPDRNLIGLASVNPFEGDSFQGTEPTEEIRGRVVNSWFSKGGRALRATTPLRCNKTYSFCLDVGPRRAFSHVQNAQQVPEHYLDQFREGEDLELDVCIHSDDFRSKDKSPFPRKTLRLPPSSRSTEIRFELRTPDKPGSAWLRACVYYRQNLLQSLRVTAQIVEEPGTEIPFGNIARVEFSMADTMLDIEDLQARTLNVLTNNAGDTHTFVIHGEAFSKQYTFPDTPAMKLVRDELQAICSKLDANGDLSYLFADDNSGTQEKLVADLKALAAAGYSLYVKLVVDPTNQSFEEDLRSLLAKPGAVQISVTDSDKHVFPWALLYDKPFVASPGNAVCPEILKIIAAGATAEEFGTNSCTHGFCPHASDTNVICPLGFWGFRHTVEQLPANTGKIVTSIKAGEGPAMVMAAHQALAGPEHRSEIEQAMKIKFVYCDEKPTIGSALNSTSPHVVYFYCHGGHSPIAPWLGVGKDDRIVPTDFHAWKTRWPLTHPLVVINGCHTVDLSPDDLLNFVSVFSWCEASGVIGTEISIPESLGREFGRFFMPRFTKGDCVTSILREFRLSLLAKWNVLGLCYTPYCYGDLHITLHS